MQKEISVMKRTTAFLLPTMFLLGITAKAQQDKPSVINIRVSRAQ
jgi:hypothetical protein